jgi:glucosamine-6-phosphate isomerase
MIWTELTTYEEMSAEAARRLLTAIHQDPEIVLGLPTGRTPVGLYERVVAECGRQYHCFQNVSTFNLDEYVGIPREHPGSYYTFMKQHLFDAIDLRPENAHVPNGSSADLDAECAAYERTISEAGGLDLTFLGLGSNGHIAFNEPGTPFWSRTRVVTLSQSTRAANASLFPEGQVPTHSITIGIGTILESREIVLMASGANKAAAIERLRSGVVSEDFPASALWRHPNVTVLVA